jgi:hypothetical protein
MRLQTLQNVAEELTFDEPFTEVSAAFKIEMLFHECETAEIGLGTEFSVDLVRVGLVGG